MTEPEFKTQVFKEPKQWQSGLYYRLRMPEKGGVALAAMPAVSRWIDVGVIMNPACLATDECGKLFLIDTGDCRLYRYDPLAERMERIPCFSGPVAALAVDRKGNLYAAGPEGLALLTANQRFSHEQGMYYSKTLDSGIQGCQWHRLALQAALPPRTALEIYYYSSDDAVLKGKIDDILSDQKTSTHQKKELIDSEIPETAWIGPERDPVDMLFREKTGRYLWLRLVLSTFDNTVTPSITGLKVYYPRTSYLRYLPAIYQEDPLSREFLERFLSLFESQFFDLETEITRLFSYFDPSLTPPDFLEWLASWLNVALEQQWPEAQKRRLIAEAYQLYRLKGTPAGIMKLVEIYTGKAPRILEHAAMGAPLVLGREFGLGINSLLVRTPIRGFRLGDDSILGRVALRDEAYSPADPFLPLAHRFTVLLDLSEAEYGRYREGLVRLLDAEKPADTSYHLRNIQETGGGIGTFVGINSRVDGYRAMKIGVNSILGSNLTLLDNDEPCGKIERRSLVGKDAGLH